MSSLPKEVLAAVDRQDSDFLLARIDDLCSERQWSVLTSLRDFCDGAAERGRQLYGVVSHIDYRLALESPGEIAGQVLRPGGARFALGPLTEVCASTHEWSEIRDHITDEQSRAFAAQERIVRGEDLSGDRLAGEEILELPLRLLDWEPPYPLAVYESHAASFPAPEVAATTWRPIETATDRDRPGDDMADERTGSHPDIPEIGAALRAVTQVWCTESNGRSEVVTVTGGLDDAIRALAPSRTEVSPCSTADALSQLCWAASSGGAFGRRRGNALGRFSALWFLALLAGLDWPLDIEGGEHRLADLEFARFRTGAPATGWELRLAAVNRHTNLATAIDAVDSA